mgnify:CR=1 FL=1
MVVARAVTEAVGLEKGIFEPFRGGADFLGLFTGRIAIGAGAGLVPGIDVIFAASTDLSNFSGLKQGDPGYETMVRRIHDVTLQHKIALGGPQAWKGRPGFTFFQAPSDTQIIRLGAQVNLGLTPGSKQDKPGIAPTEGAEKK